VIAGLLAAGGAVHAQAPECTAVVYPMDPAWLTGRSAPGRAAERWEAGRRL